MQALFKFSFVTNFRPYYLVLVLYFASVLHSYTLATSLLAIMQIGQALFEVPTGIISDKVGRVFSIKLGVVMEIAALLMYASLPHYWTLACASVLLGFAFALFSGNNNALIYDSARDAGKRASFHSFYSRINVAFEISGFIAAVLAGFIAAHSYHLVFWVSIVPQFVGLIMASRLTEPERVTKVTDNVLSHLKETLRAYKKNVRLRKISFTSILGGGVGGARFNLLPAYYGQYVPLSFVGALVSCNYLASAIGFRASNWFMKHFKPINILLTSEIYSRVMSFVALASSTITAPIAMALSAITYGPQDVAMQYLLHEDFTDAQRATMASLNSLLTSIMYAIFLVITGFVTDKYGLTAAFLLCNICVLPIILIYRSVFRDALKKQ